MKNLTRTHTFVRMLRNVSGKKKYNPTTYFKDHQDLVHKWGCAITNKERHSLETEIEELNQCHLKYISRKQGEL